jgi:hypothetical protein
MAKSSHSRTHARFCAASSSPKSPGLLQVEAGGLGGCGDGPVAGCRDRDGLLRRYRLAGSQLHRERVADGEAAVADRGHRCVEGNVSAVDMGARRQHDPDARPAGDRLQHHHARADFGGCRRPQVPAGQVLVLGDAGVGHVRIQL